MVVLDAVVLLPDDVRSAAVDLSARLGERMRALGCAPHFRLGEPFPGEAAGDCEPHVSVFMLTVDESEVDGVLAATRRVAAALPALSAEGESYRHNPQGAPELYFRRTPEWVKLQRAVVESLEPLRRGRLRELDPSGASIRELMEDPRQDPARRRQLAAYGYDEIAEEWAGSADGADDRFNPHVTLAWPDDPDCRVDLGGLPPPGVFSAPLTELALYGMSPYGTCTTRYGAAPLGRSG